MRWLKLEGKRLKARLLEAGLAPCYVRRVTRELNDHVNDIEAELISSGRTLNDAAHQARERLGSVDDLEQQIRARPPKQSLVARYPAIAFSIGSFGAAALLVMGTLAIFLLIAHGIEMLGYSDQSVARLLGFGHYYFASYAAVPLMTAFMCWTAYWYRVRLRWAFLAAVILGVVGGLLFETTLTVTSAAAAGHHGDYSIGFGYYGDHAVRSFWRLLSPFAVFGAFALLMRMRDAAYRMEI